jgi:hypothetical protein
MDPRSGPHEPPAPAAAPEPQAYPTCGMTAERFQDRWEHYINQPQQVSGVWTLYDAIRALPGGCTVLDEAAPWALRFSEPPPAPPPSANKNPIAMVWQSQNDNLSGTGWRECFSSSMAMIAMYWGKVANDDEYNKVRARYGDTTDPNAQMQALRSLGLNPFYFQNGRSSDLEREINEGRPVGVGWLHNGPVSNPSGGGHWTVVSGHTADHWIHEDPNGVADLVNGGYTNQWNGHQVRYSRKNWNPRWLVGGEGDGWYMAVKP